MKYLTSVLLFLIVGFIIGNFVPHNLVFVDPAYKYLAQLAFVILIPLSLAFLGILLKATYKKIISWILFTLSIIPCFLFFAFTYVSYTSVVENGFDPSFERIQEIKDKGRIYRLYRTNGGATTSFGLVLTQEKEINRIFKTQEILHSKYRAKEGNMSLKEDKLELDIAPYYKDDKPETVEIKIKR